jgi:hypothetical protein
MCRGLTRRPLLLRHPAPPNGDLPPHPLPSLPPPPNAKTDHVWIVGSYFHYSVPGGFDEPTARDISPKPKGPFGGAGDPMYVVTATKKAEA